MTGGKLCYDLNEGAGKTIFYQTLGTDLHPVFDATHGVVIKDGDKYVNDDLTSINTVDTKLEKGTAVYSLSGIRQQQLNRGVIIVRMSDGKTVKVLLK